MEEIIRFVTLAQTDRFTITDLCEQFGISRKTAYKHLERYAAGGLKALQPRSHSSTFTFDVAHQRVKQVAVAGGVTTTTIYVGGIYERVTSGSLVQSKHYIFAPTGRIAVYTERSDASTDVRYFHTDGLGSITAVTDEMGFIVKPFAFDPWGQRLTVDPTTFATSGTTSADNGGFTRGFTDHEQLDDLGLVHMNGRVYDPVLGRFLSADPNIDGTYDPQGYNRYSYLGDNPLAGADPTGFFGLKDAIVMVVAVVVTAVVTVVTAGGATALTTAFWSTLAHAGLGAVVAGGAAGGFASGFSASLLNGASIGDAFRAGIIGAAWGAVSAAGAYGVGQVFDTMYPAGTSPSEMTDPATEIGRALTHGAVQGGITEAQGGQFRHGFYAAAFSSAAGTVAGHYMPGGGGSAIAERTAIAAVVGGTASVVGGGKFVNGAITGAFEHLFNSESEELDQDKTIVTESYYALPDSFAKKALDFIDRMDPALELKDVLIGMLEDQVVDTIDGIRMIQLRAPEVVEMRKPTWWDRFNSGRLRVDKDEISPSTSEWNEKQKFYLDLLADKKVPVDDIESIVRIRTTITTSSDGWELNKPIPDAYRKLIH